MQRLSVLAAAALVALQAAPARATDLESVLRDVAANSPALAARRSMVEAAAKRVAPAGAWTSPMLELGVVNVPVGGRFDMDPMTMKMAEVSQAVPVFGRTGLQRRSAREAQAAEASSAAMAHYEVFAAAWEAYADAYYSGRMAREAEAHRGEMDRLVQSARVRYDAGRGRLDDVLSAEAERARLLAEGVSFGAEERAARARLDALRGRDPSGGAEALDPPPPSAIPWDAPEWRTAAGPDHPRLRERAASAERYRFAARAARRMAWPDLQLRGSYGWRDKLMGVVPQDDMFSATVGFMLPIFSGQREFSEGAEMDAMARSADAEARAARLDIEQSVESARAVGEAAARTVSLLADTVVVTQQRALAASWSAYGAGSTDLWRVFEAAHALYDEQIALWKARRDLSRTQARLLALTARGDLFGVRLPPIVTGERSER
jgi:outer membrane protein TolC